MRIWLLLMVGAVGCGSGTKTPSDQPAVFVQPTPSDPTAQQFDVLAHAMAVRLPIPIGRACVVHVLPPFVVAKTLGTPG